MYNNHPHNTLATGSDIHPHIQITQRMEQALPI